MEPPPMPGTWIIIGACVASSKLVCLHHSPARPPAFVSDDRAKVPERPRQEISVYRAPRAASRGPGRSASSEKAANRHREDLPAASYPPDGDDRVGSEARGLQRRHHLAHLVVRVADGGVVGAAELLDVVRRQDRARCAALVQRRSVGVVAQLAVGAPCDRGHPLGRLLVRGQPNLLLRVQGQLGLREDEWQVWPVCSSGGRWIRGNSDSPSRALTCESQLQRRKGCRRRGRCRGA